MSAPVAIVRSPQRRRSGEGGHVVDLQRRRLLLGMAELVGSEGLESGTVGRTCQRAGVSRRTFYELFEDRDDCFLAVFEYALELLGTRVLVVWRSGGRWHERVRASLAELLQALDEHRGLARLCAIETVKGSPAVLSRRREVLEAMTKAVDLGRAEARSGSGPSPLTAESTVGGALAVVQARLLDDRTGAGTGSLVGGADTGRLSDLLNSLMAMIVLPYLGAAASRRELNVPAPPPQERAAATAPETVTSEPFAGLPLRLTYRTVRVLVAIGDIPRASNRQIADAAGIADQGQVSRLLRRLERYGLLENGTRDHLRGAPNTWALTSRGNAIRSALGV